MLRAQAWPKPDSDLIQADHSRDMELGEMIYDYLFCAGVKKEFMDNLYAMAYSRESMLAHEAHFDAQYVPGNTRRIERSKLAMNHRQILICQLRC